MTFFSQGQPLHWKPSKIGFPPSIQKPPMLCDLKQIIFPFLARFPSYSMKGVRLYHS